MPSYEDAAYYEVWTSAQQNPRADAGIAARRGAPLTDDDRGERSATRCVVRGREAVSAVRVMTSQPYYGSSSKLYLPVIFFSSGATLAWVSTR